MEVVEYVGRNMGQFLMMESGEEFTGSCLCEYFVTTVTLVLHPLPGTLLQLQIGFNPSEVLIYTSKTTHKKSTPPRL